MPATESFPISPVATSSAVLFDSEMNPSLLHEQWSSNKNLSIQNVEQVIPSNITVSSVQPTLEAPLSYSLGNETGMTSSTSSSQNLLMKTSKIKTSFKGNPACPNFFFMKTAKGDYDAA